MVEPINMGLPSRGKRVCSVQMNCTIGFCQNPNDTGNDNLEGLVFSLKEDPIGSLAQEHGPYNRNITSGRNKVSKPLTLSHSVPILTNRSYSKMTDGDWEAFHDCLVYCTYLVYSLNEFSDGERAHMGLNLYC